jgi:hypothetical protein
VKPLIGLYHSQAFFLSHFTATEKGVTFDDKNKLLLGNRKILVAILQFDFIKFLFIYVLNQQQNDNLKHQHIVAMEKQQCVLCVMLKHVTPKNIKMLSVAQQCFHGEFTSPATIKRTSIFM